MTVVEVKGLKELREVLIRKLPLEVQGKPLQQALTRAARPITSEAKALAPVKTGRLRQAIYSTRAKSSTPTRQERVITVRSGKKHGSKDAFYWKWVEFGHRIGNKATGTLAGKGRRKTASAGLGAVPAQPFMRPAFESQKQKAAEIFRDALGKLIEKAALKHKVKP